MKTEKLWIVAIALGLHGCAPATDQNVPEAQPASAAAAPEETGPTAAELAALAPGDTIPGLPSWTRADWELLSRTVAWARDHGVDTLPIGARIARIGETFVGDPYVPGTLDPPGAERMVVNLHEFDCVTFVENVLALAHFTQETPTDVLAHPGGAMRAYQDMLERIRYRNGRLDGYPSRLHYFTEWLSDNGSRGHLRLITQDLGGIVDAEPISFMSQHRASYQQLADDANYAAIGTMEERLNTTSRYFIPEGKVAEISSRIQDGDVLAMASTVKGLDVAHTGIAIWKNGGLHLMNAPLVGKSVEISEKTLADRLVGIGSQDGLMVGRPLEKPLLGAGN